MTNARTAQRLERLSAELQRDLDAVARVERMSDPIEARRIACELLRAAAIANHVKGVAEVNRRFKRGRARERVADETIRNFVSAYFVASPQASELSGVALAQNLRRRYPELKALLSESQLRQRISLLKKKSADCALPAAEPA